MFSSTTAKRLRQRSLDQRTTVVTGAASGIGAALTRRFAVLGAKLHLVDRNEEALRHVADEARARGASVSGYAVDLSDARAVEDLARAIAAKTSQLDVLVNNAGVTLMGNFEDTSLDEFDWLMQVNFWAPVRLTHALLPQLKAAPAGHVVNVSSLYGLVGPAGQAAYAASKFALRGFSEAIRHEFEDQSLMVTAVHPGGVKTGIAANARRTAAVSSSDQAAVVKRFEQKALTTPEAAAEAIARAIELRTPRLVIGPDARVVDWLQRLLPVGYWSLLRGQMGPKAFAGPATVDSKQANQTT